MLPIYSKNNIPKAKLIWDLPLRLFHWSLVIIIIVTTITGYLLEYWWLYIHIYAGYILICLLSFRLIWGVIGSYYSRFDSFPLSRLMLIKHLKNIYNGKSKQYTGHNPVGAWVIIILLSILILLLITGLLVWGGVENNGPLANIIGYQTGLLNKDIHEALSAILMGMIAIHIMGILIETIYFKHPLIKSMITGKKTFRNNKITVMPYHSLYGGIVFLCIALALFYWVNISTAKSIDIKANSIYQQECGDCHAPHHPSLHTAQNWQSIMTGLTNHYGENASLNAPTTAKITQYLLQNNANIFDTKAAHEIGRNNTITMRMTDTKYWQKKHKKIKIEDFSISTVGSKINCNACHNDADTGNFSSAEIKLPQGIKP